MPNAAAWTDWGGDGYESLPQIPFLALDFIYILFCLFPLKEPMYKTPAMHNLATCAGYLKED